MQSNLVRQLPRRLQSGLLQPKLLPLQRIIFTTHLLHLFILVLRQNNKTWCRQPRVSMGFISGLCLEWPKLCLWRPSRLIRISHRNCNNSSSVSVLCIGRSDIYSFVQIALFTNHFRISDRMIHEVYIEMNRLQK